MVEGEPSIRGEALEPADVLERGPTVICRLNPAAPSPAIRHRNLGAISCGIGRATSDVDYLGIATRDRKIDIEAIAGMQSTLHREYKLYMQRVTIVTVPADYASRLVRMFPGAKWKHLVLYALEANDLALSKLERNAERDREDVLNLARAGHLNRDILRSRYRDELRPYLLFRQEWHDKTLSLWIDMCWPQLDKDFPG